jgi:hypothetical protein
MMRLPLLLLRALVPCAGAASEGPPPGTGTLELTFQDTDSLEFPGVRVTITPESPPGDARVVHTGLDGQVSVPALPAGLYSLTAGHLCFGTVWRGSTGITPGHANTIDVTIEDSVCRGAVDAPSRRGWLSRLLRP